MSSWPARISRAVLGPILKNIFTPPNLANFIGDAQFMLAWWTLAGAAVTVPKAWLAFDGATGALIEHGETWRPDGGGPPPVITHPAGGQYEVTYDSPVEDENGNSVGIDLRYVKVFPQDSGGSGAFGNGYVTGGNVVTVEVFEEVSVGIDIPGNVYVEIF